MHKRFCLCLPRVGSLYLPVLWKSCSQISLTFKVRFPGDFCNFTRSPGWKAWHGAQNFHSSGRTSLVLFLSSLWITHLEGLGFDFYHDCTPSTILLWLLLCLWTQGIFFGGFQHSPAVDGCSLVAISVLSPEMSVRPSTPPSWTNLLFLNKFEEMSLSSTMAHPSF